MRKSLIAFGGVLIPLIIALGSGEQVRAGDVFWSVQIGFGSGVCWRPYYPAYAPRYYVVVKPVRVWKPYFRRTPAGVRAYRRGYRRGFRDGYQVGFRRAIRVRNVWHWLDP